VLGGFGDAVAGGLQGGAEREGADDGAAQAAVAAVGGGCARDGEGGGAVPACICGVYGCHGGRRAVGVTW